MKIQFIAAEKSNEVHIQDGEYSRTFRRKEQPFEVTDEEWRTLRRKKLFEQVAEGTPPPTTSEQTTPEEGGGQAKKRAGTKAQDN